jgi:hypothetical protein
MKYPIQFLFMALFMLSACGKSSDHSRHDDHDDTVDDEGPNQALYNQVNELHEDVMFKMEDLYKLKGELEEKIAKSPTLATDKKKELEQMIAGLDSADRAMRDWMHGWMSNPPDTTDQEKTREYFETEMEKIKKVNELTNDVIAKAKEEVGKK